MRALVTGPLQESSAVRQALNYPLAKAVFQRRARRFPLGAEMPGGVAPFKSNATPVPLDEIEEAILVAVGTGVSGLNLADLPYADHKGASCSGNTMIQFTGRTFASACGAHGTELFFTNDEGVYMVKLKDYTPEKAVEYEGEDDWDKIVRVFRENTVKLQDGRLEVPMVDGITFPFNQWNVNQPGTTLFMPVSDTTWEYINIMMGLMDDPNSYYIYDDMNDNAEPLKKYADDGHLMRTRPYPLSQLEAKTAMAVTGAEQPLMIENMYLMLQALGLGGWLFGASAGPVVLGASSMVKGLGFRCVETTKEGPRKRPDWSPAALPNPVGIEGLFQSYCPPWYPTPSDAVQAVYDAKWGSQGIYKDGPSPLKNRSSLDRLVPKTSDWCLQAAKDLCEYIWDTYGRFPASMDAMQMSLWFQAHHLETDFYDTFYEEGAYHENIANHFNAWHSPVTSKVSGKSLVSAS